MQRLAGLDRLTASPLNYWGGMVLDGAVATALLVAGATHVSSTAWIATAAVGATAFSLLEYAAHRWLYHELPTAGRHIHGRHHAEARRPIGAPFFFSLLVGAASWMLAWPIVGAALAAVFTGTLLGAFAYQSALHHLLHRGWLRGTPLLASLRRHHALHHRRGDVNFGLTSTVWDRVLGTTAPPE
jgi:sterol desaturase/sphingolipid hydroxylase (fatty acid hydroxylase superfamily)